jgi:hypothetical protein
MAIFLCPIPKIPDEHGGGWEQPAHEEIKFTSDGYAVVSKTGLAELKQYDTTFPSGVYAGKMWKREETGELFLCWYQDDPVNPKNHCEVKFRKILPQEAFDLINPSGKDNL